MIKLKIPIQLVLPGVALLLVSCGGGGGSSANNTASGQDSVITKTRSTAPVATCSNGGISVDAGIDTNSNGILDASEVTSTQYVCNGTNATNVLVSVATEPSGANCASGGKKVSVGPDTNGNSNLEDAEITSSDFICNGVAGPGVTWVNVSGTSVQAAANTGYLANNPTQVTITLPATPAIGDVVQVTGVGSGGWKIDQNAGQSIIVKDVIGAKWYTTGGMWRARGATKRWTAVATSADGTKLVAVAGFETYTSPDGGLTWILAQGMPHSSILSVASSADGSKLVAVGDRGIATSSDTGVTWTSVTGSPTLNNIPWRSVVSSSDGSKLVAIGGSPGGGVVAALFGSNNGGLTWGSFCTFPFCGSLNWRAVALSGDGSTLVAAPWGGQIHISTDGGAKWTPRESARNWVSVASSVDGSKLIAAEQNGQIYTSADAGVTWTARDTVRNWISVASSSDGSKLVAVEQNGQIYTSTDSGITWSAHDSARKWTAVASSADGLKLVAAVDQGQLYTSLPSTTPGITGSLSGAQYESVDLQCVDANTFMVRGYVGNLVVQ